MNHSYSVETLDVRDFAVIWKDGLDQALMIKTSMIKNHNTWVIFN